ncbi:hypothetical protein GJ688_19730 [Heliobacillus mobilis]|uniref:Pycsar effector protein domain-containing protein n=1 Tax=Heliobacterium mobile TaxID=28064 RepID=A0A6I3SQU8_HELMO|nr:hypothetical protein [Heliobacterium mobile]MTV51086.1 hypothetical protein [Heliobacterium mobile]
MIEDTQGTIRFTDTKASITLVLTGIAINFLLRFIDPIFNVFSLLLNHKMKWAVITHDLLLLICFVILVLFSLALWIIVTAIAPNSNPTKSIIVDELNPPNSFYLTQITPKVSFLNVLNDKDGFFVLRKKSSELLKEITNLTELEFLSILSKEFLKLCYIRELKIQRVRRAIKLIKLCLILLLVVAISRSLIKIYI